MVHQIILKKIPEDSDAYTYIEPHIKENDGHKYIIALQESFENDGMIQEKVLKANLTLKNLVYRDERQMNFDIFSTKFQAAIYNFSDCGQDKYKPEVYIIDELCPQIQCPGLTSYIDAMKIAQIRTPVKYKILLQNIATQLSSISGKTNMSRDFSEFGQEGWCTIHERGVIYIVRSI